MSRLAAPLLIVLALAVAGCGAETSQEEFEAQVRESRDRTNAALANIATAEDWDQLLLRIRAASDQTRAAAEDLDETGAPSDLEDEANELVLSLRGLSDELDATADALEEEPTFEQAPVSALEFAFWDRMQEALNALRQEGVEVAPLERHAPPEDDAASS